MRVRLKAGKQRELIYFIKTEKNFSWSELSAYLNVKESSLKDWKLERNLIPYSIYKKLDKNGIFKKSILEKLPENWGQKKGGRTSSGRTKDILKPNKNKKFAEFIGIMLGDGNIFVRKEKGIYQARIAANSKDELEYLEFIAKLAKKLFGIEPRITNRGTPAEYVCLDSRKITECLSENGLKSGNKILNKITIPVWIKEDNDNLKACIRGLIDTDGSVFRMSSKDPNLIRINFKNHNFVLLKDVRKSLIKLGYHPSKIINGNTIYISRQGEVKRYIKEIGFNNTKHRKRLQKIAPWCSGQILSGY